MDFVLITEEWRAVPIAGFETLYLVSNLGRVKRIATKTGKPCDRVLRPKLNTAGYPFTGMSANGLRVQRSVHQLVAAAFIGPCPKGKEVNHKNRIKHDNRVENLEYVTRKQNIRHYFWGGTHAKRPKKEKAITKRVRLTLTQQRQLMRHIATHYQSRRQFCITHSIHEMTIHDLFTKPRPRFERETLAAIERAIASTPEQIDPRSLNLHARHFHKRMKKQLAELRSA